jgi:hypothetical protein
LVLATNRGVVSVDVSQPPGVVQASVLSPTFAWGLASADGALIVAEPAGAGTNVLRLDPATGVSTLITTVATNVYDLASFSDICASIVDVCNGIDDDHDELVDEGAPDTDGDGVADCVDEEGCDGLDNDGDGFVDEGMPDTDGDGTADCVDVEVCNGVDDDGNGLVDDADSDSDGDGILDCDDVEACDDVDNDGDGLNNEGYDLDEDGISDCFESPCDVTDPTWWYSTVDGVITRVNPASGQRWTIGPTWPDLTDVAWAADGVLYGVTAAGELVSIDPVTGEGTFDRHIGAGALGLGADSDGNLWIGYDDRIKRVNLFDGGTDSWDGLGADVHDLTMLNGGPEAVVFNAGIGKSLILPFVPASGSFGSPYYLDNSVWTGLIPGLPGGVAVSIFQISRYVNPTFGAMSQGPAIGAPNTTGAASRVDACTVR